MGGRALGTAAPERQAHRPPSSTVGRPAAVPLPRRSKGFPFCSSPETVRITRAFGAVSATLAGQAGVGEDELVVPVPDDAGRHVSGDPVVPPGIGPAFPPPRTPEPRAAGCPRPPASGAVANRRFASPADLDAASGERRRPLAPMPEVIEAVTGSAWWPAVTPSGPAAHRSARFGVTRCRCGRAE